MKDEQTENELKQLRPAELSQAACSRLQAALHAARSEARGIAQSESDLCRTFAPVHVSSGGMTGLRGTLLSSLLSARRCREYKLWRRRVSAAAAVVLCAVMGGLIFSMVGSEKSPMAESHAVEASGSFTAIAQRRIVPCDMPPPPPPHSRPPHGRPPHHADMPPHFHGEPPMHACGCSEHDVLYHDSFLFKDTDNTVLYISVPNRSTMPFDEVI